MHFEYFLFSCHIFHLKFEQDWIVVEQSSGGAQLILFWQTEYREILFHRDFQQDQFQIDPKWIHSSVPHPQERVSSRLELAPIFIIIVRIVLRESSKRSVRNAWPYVTVVDTQLCLPASNFSPPLCHPVLCEAPQGFQEGLEQILTLACTRTGLPEGVQDFE